MEHARRRRAAVGKMRFADSARPRVHVSTINPDSRVMESPAALVPVIVSRNLTTLGRSVSNTCTERFFSLFFFPPAPLPRASPRSLRGKEAAAKTSESNENKGTRSRGIENGDKSARNDKLPAAINRRTFSDAYLENSSRLMRRNEYSRLRQSNSSGRRLAGWLDAWLAGRPRK